MARECGCLGWPKKGRVRSFVGSRLRGLCNSGGAGRWALGSGLAAFGRAHEAADDGEPAPWLEHPKRRQVVSKQPGCKSRRNKLAVGQLAARICVRVPEFVDEPRAGRGGVKCQPWLLEGRERQRRQATTKPPGKPSNQAQKDGRAAGWPPLSALPQTALESPCGATRRCCTQWRIVDRDAGGQKRLAEAFCHPKCSARL